MTIYKMQRGDTIIEVLLAMAVLGMVLGTSFGIVNRSLATGRDAQERSEASKLAESQLEKLKTASSDPDNGFFNIAENSIYCITDALDVFYNTGTFQDDVDLDNYADECKSGPDGRYRLSIIRSGNVFTVRARWNSIQGDQLNEAKMTYRTYSYSSREYPVVSTDQSVSVTGLSATVTGRVTDQGKTAVTKRGFIYNTVAGQHPSDGTIVEKDSGLGEFSTILNLSPNTIYYVRAYATNGSGTSYGSEVQFSTQANQAPNVGDPQPSNIATTSALISSSVSDGGSTVTRQGVIIGSSSNLVIDSDRTINSSPLGSIALTIGGLTPNTAYYVKTFAINSVGTTYSNLLSFITSTIVSSVPLNPPATFNGNTYYLSSQIETWASAKAISSASGGHLVSITSKAENDFVSTLAGGQGTWIGFNDIANEGVWVWDGGEPTGSYTNWSTTEPNNYFNGTEDEDVAVMNWSGGAWNDWFNNSATKAYFVIEFEK
jgi:type II secretory pathway pseudopilin PulG